MIKNDGIIVVISVNVAVFPAQDDSAVLCVTFFSFTIGVATNRGHKEDLFMSELGS